MNTQQTTQNITDDTILDLVPVGAVPERSTFSSVSSLRPDKGIPFELESDVASIVGGVVGLTT